MINVIRRYRDTNKEVSPFKFVVVVRDLWSVIMPRGRDISQYPWEGLDQNIGWIRPRIIPLILQNRIGEKLNIEVVAGSKVEKISIIIKVYQEVDIVCFEGR